MRPKHMSDGRWWLSHTFRGHAGAAALTRGVLPEGLLGFVPHGLAVFLQSEVAGLLP